jgi:glycosyltransferase involved in cell wall biosynthesis
MEGASNAGLARARGRSVIFLDDDDTWEPTCLERLVAAREAGPDARAAVCHSVEVMERVSDDRLEQVSETVWNGDLVAVSLSALAVRNLFTNNAFLVDRDVVEALGAFEPGFRVYGDWDFNLRFFARHDAVVVPLALARYHRREQGTGTAQNSFAQGPGVAAGSRARLLRLWLAGEGGRSPAVGQLLALGEHLERQASVAARIDKVLNALHRVRHFGPVAALERALGRPERG